MKKLILCGLLATISHLAFGQVQISDSVTTQVKTSEETMTLLHKILETPSEIKDYDNVVWKLFPTTNMWTFLKLNTRNGVIYQLQFHIDSANRMETLLNPNVLAEGKDAVNGRFTLYATQNMWIFILLDQIDGRAYQVQWNPDSSKQMIMRIDGLCHLREAVK